MPVKTLAHYLPFRRGKRTKTVPEENNQNLVQGVFRNHFRVCGTTDNEQGASRCRLARLWNRLVSITTFAGLTNSYLKLWDFAHLHDSFCSSSTFFVFWNLRHLKWTVGVVWSVRNCDLSGHKYSNTNWYCMKSD